MFMSNYVVNLNYIVLFFRFIIIVNIDDYLVHFSIYFVVWFWLITKNYEIAASYQVCHFVVFTLDLKG
jgi:hypothetical protein